MVALLKKGDKVRLVGQGKREFTVTKVSLKWQCVTVQEYINAIPFGEVISCDTI